MPLLFCYGVAACTVSALAVLASAGLCYIIYQRFFTSLRDIPGPFLASFTDLWRLLAVEHGKFEVTTKKLHDKYGDLVRVGPNLVSVGDPRQIKHIYGITRLFQKVWVLQFALPWRWMQRRWVADNMTSPNITEWHSPLSMAGGWLHCS